MSSPGHPTGSAPTVSPCRCRSWGWGRAFPTSGTRRDYGFGLIRRWRSTATGQAARWADPREKTAPAAPEPRPGVVGIDCSACHGTALVPMQPKPGVRRPRARSRGRVPLGTAGVFHARNWKLTDCVFWAPNTTSTAAISSASSRLRMFIKTPYLASRCWDHAFTLPFREWQPGSRVSVELHVPRRACCLNMSRC